MENINTIFKKEVRSYINSPIAYLVIFFFLIVTSIWFYFMHNFIVRDTASFREYFEFISIFIIFLIPAVTMRLWAEEKRMGTEELLLTLPFKEYEIVLGKFLSSLALIGVMLALTLPIPLSLSFLGRFDMGQIFSEYLGLALYVSVLIAIGQFISVLSINQIMAFIITLLILFVINFSGFTLQYLKDYKILSKIVKLISVNNYFENFNRGVIDTRDLMYFVLTTFLFLYFNTKALVLKKWK